MSLVATGAVTAAKFGGAGLVVYTIGRVWMHFLDWLGKRWDAWQLRLAEKEAIADASIAGRLKHLEQQQQRDAKLIAGLYRALSVLTVKVAAINPFDPSLVEVRDIIAAALDVVEPDKATPQDMLDSLGRVK